MRLDPDNLRTTAMAIEMITSVIVTLHVIFIHDKIRKGVDDNGKEVLLNDNESLERAFLIAAVVLYIIAFALLLLGDHLKNKKDTKRIGTIESLLIRGSHSTAQERIQ